jgi:hypothetical protein
MLACAIRGMTQLAKANWRRQWTERSNVRSDKWVRTMIRTERLYNVRSDEWIRTMIRTTKDKTSATEDMRLRSSMDVPSNASVSTEAGGLRGNCPLQEVIEKKESTSRST